MNRLAVGAIALSMALSGCDRHPTQPLEHGEFRRPSFTAITPGEMIDLGTLGGNWSEARGINEAGQVVGMAYTAGQGQRAFLWTQTEGMRDLGYLNDTYPYSLANDINDRGQVVGWSYVFDGRTANQRAMIWSEAEGMRELPLLGTGCSNPASEALAINNNGVVTGYSTGADCYYYAVRWGPDGSVQQIAAELNSRGNDINDLGHIVGLWPGFIWTPAEGHRELNPLFAWPPNPFGINDAGQIVGQSGYGGFVRAPDGEYTLLTSLGPGLQTTGEAINEQGQIAGSSYLLGTCGGGACQRAVFWSTPDDPVHLGTLGGPQSWAYDLNERGQVVGAAETATGARRAFLYQVDVTPPNDPPYFIHPADGSRYQFTAGHETVLGVRAADPNPGDRVTLGVENLPAGASFPIPAPANPVESVFRWTPAPDQLGEHHVTFTATDNHGEPAQVTVIIEINAPSPPPPPACIDPRLEILAWTGSTPGTISLSRRDLQVQVQNVERHIPAHQPGAQAGDLRLGSHWATATPAQSFRVRDFTGDGNRDVRLVFRTERLVSEGNLSTATERITLWGRDPVSGELYCGSTDVAVMP